MHLPLPVIITRALWIEVLVSLSFCLVPWCIARPWPLWSVWQLTKSNMRWWFLSCFVLIVPRSIDPRVPRPSPTFPVAWLLELLSEHVLARSLIDTFSHAPLETVMVWRMFSDFLQVFQEFFQYSPPLCLLESRQLQNYAWDHIPELTLNQCWGTKQ